jgi:hypothetical protein
MQIGNGVGWRQMTGFGLLMLQAVTRDFVTVQKFVTFL